MSIAFSKEKNENSKYTFPEQDEATPYDDVFRTLSVDCGELRIPLVNEVYHTRYTQNARMSELVNEHLVNSRDGFQKKIITDSAFSIEEPGVEKKRCFHMECQCEPDNTMLIRMFEYDTQIALQNGELEDALLTVRLPEASVLYLRHTRSTHDFLRIQVVASEESLEYRLPTIKLQNYSLDELLEKQLWFLIPFYIFNYEKSFPKIAENKKMWNRLKEDYKRIVAELDAQIKKGQLNTFQKTAIIDMSKKVIRNLAAGYDEVVEGVNSIMGGEVLDYEAKDILNKGISQGISQNAIHVFKNLIQKKGFSKEEAAEIAELPREMIDEIEV